RAQAQDRPFFLRSLGLLQVRQPLVGEVGHRHRLLADVDPGVLLTLEFAELVGDRLAGWAGELLPAALAVRADAHVDRGDPPFDNDAAPRSRVVAAVDRPLPVGAGGRLPRHDVDPLPSVPARLGHRMAPNMAPNAPETTKSPASA